jgi:hypothetical protein
VFTTVPEYLSVPLRSPRNAIAAAAAVAAAGGVAWYLLRRPRPSAEEIERARRVELATTGRITDGSITDAPFSQQDASSQKIIIYNYRIGGVSYEAAQDVSTLGDLVQDVRTDLPIQVRYEPHNPANSIVVAESWSGLRLSSTHPHPDSGATASHGG